MAVDPRIQAAVDGPYGARPLIHEIKRREGYAAKPGTGPFGETCHSCRHICGVRGNEYASTCRIGKKARYGGRLFISAVADACHKWEPRHG